MQTQVSAALVREPQAARDAHAIRISLLESGFFKESDPEDVSKLMAYGSSYTVPCTTCCTQCAYVCCLATY